MRVHIYGVGSVDIETGAAVLSSDWDKDARRAHTDRAVNRAIDEYTAVAKEVFGRFEFVEKRVPTQDEFRALFLELSGRGGRALSDERPRLADLYEEYIRTVCVQNSWTQATLRKVQTVGRHLMASRPPRYINDLTEESRMLHNLAVYINKLAYSATPLPREEAGDIKRKGPRHHVATLPPGWLFCGVHNVIRLRSCRPQNKPLAFKKSKLTDNSVL